MSVSELISKIPSEVNPEYESSEILAISIDYLKQRTKYNNFQNLHTLGNNLFSIAPEISELYLVWKERNWIDSYSDLFIIILANLDFRDFKIHISNRYDLIRGIGKQIEESIYLLRRFENALKSNNEASHILNDSKLNSLEKLNQLNDLRYSIVVSSEIKRPRIKMKKALIDIRDDTLFLRENIFRQMQKVFLKEKSSWENNNPEFMEKWEKDNDRLNNERKMLVDRVPKRPEHKWNVTTALRVEDDRRRIQMIDIELDKSFFLRSNPAFSRFRFLMED